MTAFPGMCRPSLVCGMGWAPCVPVPAEMAPEDLLLSHCCTVLGERKALEVVSTSPSGNETGLGSSETIPEAIRLSSRAWKTPFPDAQGRLKVGVPTLPCTPNPEQLGADGI